MRNLSRLSDRELDRLFAGKAPSDEGGLEELAAFFRDVTSVFEQVPDGPTETRHLTAIVEAAQFLAENDSAASTPAGERSEPGQRAAWFPRRKQLVPSNLFASWAAKFVLAGVLALGLFGGAAYAGALPHPVQGAVAGVAGNLGVSLPGAQDNDQNNGAQNNVDTGTQNDQNDGAQNNVDTGTQNDQNDGAKNNVDQGNQNDQNDGAQNNVDQGTQNDQNNGAQNNVDQGTQNDQNGGAQNNVGTGTQNDQNNSAQNKAREGNHNQQSGGAGNGGSGNQGGGQQGNGNN